MTSGQKLFGLHSDASLTLCASHRRCGPIRSANVNRLPASLEQVVREVTGDSPGMATKCGVATGLSGARTNASHTIRVLGRCFGPNPTAPLCHSRLFPPGATSTSTRPCTTCWVRLGRRYSPVFRLAETEALVILAELPPRVSYLGLQTYLFTPRRPRSHER